MRSTGIVRAVTFGVLLICCSAYPYEDIILSGHKARVYDVEGYTPHVPVTSSSLLRQSSKTIFTKYPLADYTTDNNLRYGNTNSRGPPHQVVPSHQQSRGVQQHPIQHQHNAQDPVAQLPPHLVRRQPQSQHIARAPGAQLPPHLVHQQPQYHAPVAQSPPHLVHQRQPQHHAPAAQLPPHLVHQRQPLQPVPVAQLPPHLVHQRQPPHHAPVAQLPPHLVHQRQPPYPKHQGNPQQPPRYQSPHAPQQQRYPQLMNRSIVEDNSLHEPQEIHHEMSLPHIASRYYEYIDALNSEFDD
ncbi:uncharacterized protein LOC118268932 isoform X20 [Spodoptera frugiperda]|uniref:Uncharacterized protein LOC118268932 isoform X20 n=1 Tax=Spodoptera frugiperda TaxID=7108 RepID=A0A9R0DZL7_SPOFR|nr:uncharacterized protein LOC118268932 isoform X20 [Spodoptera frugiperda]